MNQFAQKHAIRDRAAAPWLFAAREPALLGSAFDFAWPLDEALRFGDLLREIDEAERSAGGQSRS